MRVNREIRAEKLMVIDETGKNLGVLEREDAFRLAQGKSLDLIEVNPATNPPVAKILDYGKFEYHQRKAAQKMKASRQRQELKIVRIGLKTSIHDAEVKAQQTTKFLQKDCRVKLEIFLRGREKAHRALAKEKLAAFEKLIQEPHKVDGPMTSTLSGWSMMLHK